MISQIIFVLAALVLDFYLAKATAKVASNKGGDAGLWFVSGLLLPGVALIVALLWDEQPNRECPRCRRRIDQIARMCGYCGHSFARDEVVPE